MKIKWTNSKLGDTELSEIFRKLDDLTGIDVKGTIINQALFSIEKRLRKIAILTGIDLEDTEKAHDILDLIEAKINNVRETFLENAEQDNFMEPGE